MYIYVYIYVWYILRRNHANNWPAAATVEGLARNNRQTLSLYLAFFLTHTNNKIESDTYTLIDTLTHTQ